MFLFLLLTLVLGQGARGGHENALNLLCTANGESHAAQGARGYLEICRSQRSTTHGRADGERPSKVQHKEYSIYNQESPSDLM